MRADNSQLGRARRAFDDWLASYVAPNYPERVDELRKLVKAYDRALALPSLQPEVLTLVLQTILKNDTLSEFAAELLGDLAVKYSEARAGVAQLVAHRQLALRIFGLVALSALATTESGIDLYRRCLTDKSRKMRILVASHAERFDMRELIGDITHAITIEKDPEVRRHFVRARDLLTAGFHEWSDAQGNSWITRRIAKGVFTTEPKGDSR